MNTPCRLSSHKVTPIFYSSNPYRDFASFQYVMVAWNGNICKIKNSWAYILTTKSKLVVRWFLIELHEVIVKNVCSSSPNCKLNKFEIFKNSLFQNHTKCKPSPNLNCWIVIEWGFHGSFIIRLHGGHKKLNYCSNKTWSSKGTCDLPSSWVIL